jgi:hypothetical protein
LENATSSRLENATSFAHLTLTPRGKQLPAGAGNIARS